MRCHSRNLLQLCHSVAPKQATSSGKKTTVFFVEFLETFFYWVQHYRWLNVEPGSLLHVTCKLTLRIGGTSSAARNLRAFSIWPRRRLQRSCKSSIVIPSVDVPDNASRIFSVCSLLGKAFSPKCLHTINTLQHLAFWGLESTHLNIYRYMYEHISYLW